MTLLSECEITVRRTSSGVRLESGDEFLDVPAAHVPALIAALKAWSAAALAGQRYDTPAERIAPFVRMNLCARASDVCGIKPADLRREFLDGGLDVSITGEGLSLYLSPAQAGRVAAVLTTHRCWQPA